MPIKTAKQKEDDKAKAKRSAAAKKAAATRKANAAKKPEEKIKSDERRRAIQTDTKKEKKKKHPYIGLKLGVSTIVDINPKTINKRQYNSVKVDSGETFDLSDKDLESQIVKE